MPKNIKRFIFVKPKPMFTIALSGLKFQSKIGLYPEEKTLHNTLELDLSLSRERKPCEAPLLNYETIYSLVRKEVEKPENLLENLLERIVSRLQYEFPETHLSVEIKKINPPFEGEVEYASVKWED